jgi:hypothetical protein
MNIDRCPEQGLSADYGDIILSGLPAGASVYLEISCNNAVILTEAYSSDQSGSIRIRDIAQLAGMYRQENNISADVTSDQGAVTLNLKLEERVKDPASNNFQVITTENRTITVFFCSVETAGTLTVEKLQTIPLTRCFRKPVCPGQKEYISFYGPGAVTLDVIYTGTEKDLFARRQLAALADNKIHRLDVSPETVAGIAGIESSRIAAYYVYKNKNSIIEFTMNKYLRPEKTFVFYNSFGAQETFTCTGDRNSEWKWTREYGQINRRRHLIGREMGLTDSIHTGYLTREQVAVVEDMLNARRIAVIDECGRQPASITEEKFEVTSRRDELIDVEFKYRLASNNQMQFRYRPYQYIIFDETFNHPPFN